MSPEGGCRLEIPAPLSLYLVVKGRSQRILDEILNFVAPPCRR